MSAENKLEKVLTILHELGIVVPDEASGNILDKEHWQKSINDFLNERTETARNVDTRFRNARMLRSDINRRREADLLYSENDLLGYQVEDAGGWSYIQGGDTWTRVIYVKSDNDGPSIAKTLTIVFSHGYDSILRADIDGDTINL